MSCDAAVLLSVLYKFASTTNLFKYLRKRYDQQLVHELNHLIKLKGKRVRSKEGIRFLRDCLSHRVAPVHIKERVRKAKPKNPGGIERVFVRDELEKKQDFLKRVTEEYKSKLCHACKSLSFFDVLRFCKLVNLTSERLSQQAKIKNEKTLQQLLRTQQGIGVLRHSTIVNLTNIELTDTQKNVLCRGLGYGLPPRISKEAIEAEFELCWQQLEDLTTTESRRRQCKTAMANLAQRYGNSKIDKTGFPLSDVEIAAIKELKRNKEVIISRPDKGNGVVIMNRAEYVDKMNVILADDSKFERLGGTETHDHTLQQERALQAFLLRAVNAGHIRRDVYDRIRPVGSTRPRMYGIPKLHKAGVPLRPILSMTNAPQHEMAKWLAEVLRPVVNKYSRHTIKDTFEFCRNIEEFQSQNDTSSMFMCSFDISSLFTCIPLEKTIEICLDALYREEDIAKPTVPEKVLKKLLLKATTEVEFSFNDTMYRQVDGVAMGSPLGPILANVFVGYCEDAVEDDQWPLYYDRFVDDTFSIFTSEEKSVEFFNTLNNLHPSLRFTVECEKDGVLPFMDVSVKRVGGGLERSVYRKLTFTGLYTRWDSFSPTSQKIALMRSLTSRGQRICSPAALTAEMECLKKIFLDNGYPEYLVQRFVKPKSDALDKPLQQVEEGPTHRNVTIRLPWIGRISSSFGSEIRSTITKGFPEARPRVIFSTNRPFSGRQKDVLPATSQSLVVYEFTCRCAQTYVGKTSQCLEQRIKQHVPAKLMQPIPDVRQAKSDSAITRYLKDGVECIDPDLTTRFKIIARARHQCHLGVLEAIYIRAKSPVLCSQKEHVRHLSLV